MQQKLNAVMQTLQNNGGMAHHQPFDKNHQLMTTHTISPTALSITSIPESTPKIMTDSLHKYMTSYKVTYPILHKCRRMDQYARQQGDSDLLLMRYYLQWKSI